MELSKALYLRMLGAGILVPDIAKVLLNFGFIDMRRYHNVIGRTLEPRISSVEDLPDAVAAEHLNLRSENVLDHPALILGTLSRGALYRVDAALAAYMFAIKILFKNTNI